MRPRLLLLGLLLAIAGVGLWILMHGGVSKSPSNGGVAPESEPSSKELPEEGHALVEETVEATRVIPNASEPEVELPAVTNASESADAVSGVVLKGVIQAKQPSEPTNFRVEVIIEGQPEHKETLVQDGPGPFQLRLDPFVSRSKWEDLKVRVVCSAEGFQTASAYADKLAGERKGEHVLIAYSVLLKPKYYERRLTGKVSGHSGRALKKPWVGFLAKGDTKPITWRSVPTTSVDEDGSFALKLTTAAPGTFIAGDQRHALLHVKIQGSDRDQDLGELELPEGATISGRAFRGGVPLEAGDKVLASLPYKASPLTLQRKKLHLQSGRVVHTSVSTQVGTDGEFKLEGLEAGMDYRVVPLSRKDKGRFMSHGPAGKVIRAPASNIILEGGLVDVILSVRSQGRPVPNAEVRAIAPSEGEWSGLPIFHRGGWQSPVRGNSAGKVRLLLGESTRTHLEISADQFERKMILVDTDDLPPTGEVLVELESGVPTASLEIRLKGAPAEEIKSGWAVVYLFDHELGLRQKGPLNLRDGIIVVPDLPVGTKEINLAIVQATGDNYDNLPFSEPGTMQFPIDPLKAQEHRVHELELTIGGRIELEVTGCLAETGSPEFELQGPDGKKFRPKPHLPNAKGQAEKRPWIRDGPGLLGKWLAPGRYTVRQVGEAYLPESFEVLVLAGQVSTMSIALASR